MPLTRQRQSPSLPAPAPADSTPLPSLCATFLALTPEQQIRSEALLRRMFGHLRQSSTPEGRIDWINHLYATGHAMAIYWDDNSEDSRPHTKPAQQAQQ